MTDYVYKPAFEKKFKRHYKKMVKGGRYKPEDFEKVYRRLLMDLPLEPKHNEPPVS